MQNNRTSFLVGFRHILLCGTPARQHSKAPSFCGSEGKAQLRPRKNTACAIMPSLPSLCTLSTAFPGFSGQMLPVQMQGKQWFSMAKNEITGRRPTGASAQLRLALGPSSPKFKICSAFFAQKRFGKLYSNSILKEINSKAPIALEELDLRQCSAKSHPAVAMPSPALKTVSHTCKLKMSLFSKG